MKIVTYNLRCVWKGDGINGFMHRAGMLWEKMRAEKPDVVAFQEVVSPNRELLEQLMPEYVFCGHYRNADYRGEGVFTAVRRETLELLGYETFWLSPTPYVPGSRYENQSDCPRICLVTQVRNRKTNEVYRIYNLHLDHVSDEARINGMTSVLDYMSVLDEKVSYESVILGDFNATPDSGCMKLCNTYKKRPLTDVTAALPVTFHNYGKCGDKIDYIYVTEKLTACCTDAVIWDDCDNGIYLSDHYPVCATFAVENR